MTRCIRHSILFVLLFVLLTLGTSGCAGPGATNSADRVRIDRIVLSRQRRH